MNMSTLPLLFNRVNQTPKTIFHTQKQIKSNPYSLRKHENPQIQIILTFDTPK